MELTNSRRIATLELSASCLQEAVERLHRLCPQLKHHEHELECSETANNIFSQVLLIRQEVAELRNGM
jgi:hypothetical protein